MKFQILSDLHIETKPYDFVETDADVLVLAGDIDRAGKGLEWGLKAWPDKPLLYVMGNHEYHGYSVTGLVPEIKAKIKGTNAHLLEDEVIEIDGVRIFGATLWTDFTFMGNAQEAMDFAAEKLKDHKNILRGDFAEGDGETIADERLKPEDKLVLHNRSLDALKKAGPVDVVISHHAPSRLSIPENRWSLRSGSSASDLDDMVAQYANTLWIHGHTHVSADYKIGDVRVVSNPRGYIPFEANEEFQDQFVVEI